MPEKPQELKRLVFAEGLLLSTLTHEKKITLRRYREGSHDFNTGEIIKGLFNEGPDAWVVLLEITADTEKKKLDQITDEEAREDGFLDASDAFGGMKAYYHDLTNEDVMALIRFQIPRINGFPTINLKLLEE